MKNQLSGLHGKKRESYKLFLYVLPCILFIFIFKYLPLWGWSFAFFQYKPGRSLADSDFVGLQNFTVLFGNAVMRKNLIRVLRNTLGIQLINYLLLLVPMLFAIFLSEVKSIRFQKVVQTLTTLPHFISWIIMFSLATSLFGNNGIVNSLLEKVGLHEINLLTTDQNVWLIQSLLGLWKSLGWSAIIYFASIAGLDQEVYEAAMVDGASRWQKIKHITIPLLLPTFFVLLIMGIGNFLNSGIDQFLAFGNAMNKEYIEVLDLYTYNLGIGSGQISFSVAVGMMKSVVAIALFAIANFFSKRVRGTSVF
jgi:putative aldouronate transport system permease protein